MSDSLVTPWTIARQTLLSIGFPRQEYWRGLPFPLLGNLSDPGINPVSPALQVNFLPPSHVGSPWHIVNITAMDLLLLLLLLLLSFCVTFYIS